MLTNHVVAVTGGAGLIGSKLVRIIVESGGKVIIGDVSEDKGKDLQNEIGIDQALFVYVDTTDIGSIDNFIECGKNHFGKIDSAVHSAYPRSKQWGTKFEELKPEGLQEDLFNQLGGALLFSQRIIAEFKSKQNGNLIHVSSIQGSAVPKFEHYEGTNMVSPIEYSAIKAGILSITRYLAKYYKGNGIRVNCVSPGGILDNQPEEFLLKYRASCNEKGMLDAEDIMGALIFLLSDASRLITGQNIIIDDGWSL
jgi:NAD(P)-dependent dehydrogenase (short-subunit alcohol dehydrogenase family)